MTLNKNEKLIAYAGYMSFAAFSLHFMLFITLFGVIVLYNQGKGNEFASFHLRQMLGIAIVTFVLTVMEGRIPDVIILIVAIGLLLTVILAIISVYKNQTDPIPVIGTHLQTWFNFIK